MSKADQQLNQRQASDAPAWVYRVCVAYLVAFVLAGCIVAAHRATRPPQPRPPVTCNPATGNPSP